MDCCQAVCKSIVPHYLRQIGSAVIAPDVVLVVSPVGQHGHADVQPGHPAVRIILASGYQWSMAQSDFFNLTTPQM